MTVGQTLETSKNVDPVVSIIIVNWNGEGFLHDCFHALRDQTFSDFEIIFVDNASSDNSIETAESLASDLKLPLKIIRLSTNTGFATGNNEGLKHCSGKYIALLNNDTVVSKDWLKSLVQAMDAHPETGICASLLIVAGTDIIDSAGDCLGSSLRPFKRGEGLSASMFTTGEYVFGACAGAALYRKTMIDEIGLFDDDFFLIFEDADLNFRAQLAGWKCFFVPVAIVQHKVNASIKKIGKLATFHSVKNDKALVIKNAPWPILFKHFSLYILEEICFSLVYHARNGNIVSYLKANFHFFKNLPRLLRKRKQIMKLRKVPTSYLSGLLVSVWPMYRKKFNARIRALFGRPEPEQ